MTKLYKPALILLAVLCAVLGIITAVSFSRAGEIKDYAAKTIFYALRSVDERLEYTVSSGKYTNRDSETVLQSLYEIQTAVTAAEKLYTSRIADGYQSLYDLADALGCSYFASHNDVPVESVLYDGELGENELEFIRVLSEDVKYILAPLLHEDGMNIKDDLSYGEIRQPLDKFIEKWGFWSGRSEAPYELLNSDEEFA